MALGCVWRAVGLCWAKASSVCPCPTAHAAFPAGLDRARQPRASSRKACCTADNPQTPRWHLRAGDRSVPVCVLRRESHPLAGYLRVLLPQFSPVQEGGGKAVAPWRGGQGRRGGDCGVLTGQPSTVHCRPHALPSVHCSYPQPPMDHSTAVSDEPTTHPSTSADYGIFPVGHPQPTAVAGPPTH